MKYKIGVYGSNPDNVDDLDKSVIEKAKKIGEALGKRGVLVITGGCSGLPYSAAEEAFKNGSEVWGYASEKDAAGLQKAHGSDDTSIYKKVFYISSDFPFADDLNVCRKYRNVISTANSDAGIIIAGRWGTLNEFTNLFDMGKVIGILAGSGGIADEIENLSKKISKKSKAKIVFSSNPKELVEKVIAELDNRYQKNK